MITSYADMRTINLIIILIFIFSLTSCELIGDLLKWGFWAGVIVASIVWGGIIFLIRKLF